MAATFWLAAGLLCFAVVVPLILALGRAAGGATARLSYDVALYRDQLAELARDQEAGLVSPAETAAARLEIERRMLAAADAAESGAPENGAPENGAAESGARVPAGGRASAGITALVLAVAVPGLALLLYLQVGRPGAPDQPLGGRPERQLLTADGSLDLDRAAEALRQRVAATPGSVEGWVLLARTEAARGRWDAAREAVDRGLAAIPPDERALRAQVRGAYGEMLVGAAGGTVTPEAKDAFTRVLADDAGDVRARYFLGLAALQAGDKPAALAAWQALARESPPDAPFLPMLLSQIEAAGGAVTSPASPAGAAVAALPPAEQLQAIRGMVEGLAAKLAADPADHDGWMRLGRSWQVLGEARQAADAYAHAAGLQPADLATLDAYVQALRAADPADARLPDLEQRLAKLRGG